LFGLLGVNENKNILHGVSQKKYFTEEKLEMTYITGGKDLLTLFYFIFKFNTSLIYLLDEISFW